MRPIPPALASRAQAGNRHPNKPSNDGRHSQISQRSAERHRHHEI